MSEPEPFVPSRHPKPVLVPQWEDAEEFAAWHMRSLGFTDALNTPAGTDGGVDVRAQGAVAQVKHHDKPVGSPDVQQLLGVSRRSETPIFYSLRGYTLAAIQSAADVVALFAYDIYGQAVPANPVAAALNERRSDQPDIVSDLRIRLRDTAAPHDQLAAMILIDDRREEVAVLDRAVSMACQASGLVGDSAARFALPDDVEVHLRAYYGLIMEDLAQMDAGFARTKREITRRRRNSLDVGTIQRSLDDYRKLLIAGELITTAPYAALTHLRKAVECWVKVRSATFKGIYDEHL
ncbi:restriction endonuclease [Ruania suaedae]|uniref:restriction endonuclease n=1 Tax=Ruania suaedae TaxID=2897774 RepID=UPI001E6151A2|nr:restriction endonuclease [Ruania suaedae]UFU03844.1 restriction endonuclease [Ruania suaedae]